MNVNRRVRRTPEQARALILDTAERRLARLGLEGLNIVGVAEEAGISHATLLHHFGNAAGMRRALLERLAARLVREARAAIGDHDQLHAVLKNLFDVFAAGGHAKLLAWLAVEDDPLEPSPEMREDFRALIEDCAEELAGGDRDATRNLIALVIAAAIGLGVGGERLAVLLGMDPEARARFPDWLADHVIAPGRHGG